MKLGIKTGIAGTTALIIGFGASNLGASCSATQAAAVTSDIAGEVVCVLVNDSLPPAQIVSACGGLALQDVQTILAQDTMSTKFAGDGGVPTSPAALARSNSAAKTGGSVK